MKDYGYEEFSKLLGEELEVSDDEGNSTRLTVRKVDRAKPDDEQWTSFSVMLKSTDEEMTLTQGSYAFRHPQAGEHSFFITPLSDSDFELAMTLPREGSVSET